MTITYKVGGPHTNEPKRNYGTPLLPETTVQRAQEDFGVSKNLTTRSLTVLAASTCLAIVSVGGVMMDSSHRYSPVRPPWGAKVDRALDNVDYIVDHFILRQ
jgi:hypothetical protein